MAEGDVFREKILKDKQVLFERKKTNYSWYDSFLDLGEALDQLKEMVDEDENEKSYVRDATIQRFEFCIELFWKVLKKICAEERMEAKSPKAVLSKAFELGLVNDEPAWLQMLDDRNNTSHTYQRVVAMEIYYRIPAYYKIMAKVYERIKKEYGV